MKTNEDIKKYKVVAMYFSGNWCPPCRGFTPLLRKFYTAVNEKGKNFQIIYVSVDQDESEFKHAFKGMPWVGLPYSYDRKELA